jgi:hypothetical protein
LLPILLEDNEVPPSTKASRCDGTGALVGVCKKLEEETNKYVQKIKK